MDQYSATYVSELLILFRLAGCEAYVGFDFMNPAEMAAIYNGIGPDRFPDRIRAKITALSSIFEPAALEHDCSYEDIAFLLGTTEIYLEEAYARFNEANARFYRNCKRLVTVRYGWYNPRRYQLYFRARRYFKLCTLFGFKGIFNRSEVIFREYIGKIVDKADNCGQDRRVIGSRNSAGFAKFAKKWSVK